ncbi:MAG: hypothetical protein ACREHE_04180 [Rhizomicrobium sp.]
MDEDDLPPEAGAPQDYTASGSLGWWVGTLIWLVLVAAIAAGFVFAALNWRR